MCCGLQEKNANWNRDTHIAKTEAFDACDHTNLPYLQKHTELLKPSSSGPLFLPSLTLPLAMLLFSL